MPVLLRSLLELQEVVAPCKALRLALWSVMSDVCIDDNVIGRWCMRECTSLDAIAVDADLRTDAGGGGSSTTQKYTVQYMQCKC